MPMYDYECEQGHTVSHIRDMDARDVAAACAQCGGELTRLMSRVNLNLTTYLDGRRGAIDQGFDNMRRAAKLEVQRQNIPPAGRGEINKEIKALKGEVGK